MLGIKHRIEQFVKREGRRPRVLVSNLGQKNHDRDMKQLAACFAEAGFDVDISPLQQTPGRTARMAVENDVHLVCFLSSDVSHTQQAAGLRKALQAQQADDVEILVGGSIPQNEHQALYEIGVSLVLNSLPADRAEINQILDLFDKRT